MAQSFPETAHNKIDKKKFSDNYDLIKWPDPSAIVIDKNKARKAKKHFTAGMCGEYGMSELGSRGGIGEGVIHKEPERFPCVICGYKENRFKDFCENCLDNGVKK